MQRWGEANKILAAFLCLAMLAACSFGGSRQSGTASAAGYAAEMEKTEVMSISIEADETEWQGMLDTATEEQYISASITINGSTIENVGIRPKGNSSLRQVAGDDTTDRYSFKIKFDEYVKDQTWMGLDKLVVNNMITDNSYMKEYLSYDIMSYIGVDAPLFAFADIQVNDQEWGFYLAVEDIDSGYLARAKGDEGELYKPNNDNSGMGGGMIMPGGNRPTNDGTAMPGGEAGSGETADEAAGAQGQLAPGTGGANGAPPQGGFGGMGGGNRGGGGGMNGGGNGVSLVYTDDEIASYSAIFDNAETKTTEEDHKRVIEALKNLSSGTDLEKYVDVDAVLRYFAAHTVVVNMDSYTSNMAHNYYLYENNGQISMLPWDYNMAFGGFMGGSASDVVNQPIDTPVTGVTLEERPILGKLLEVEAYKAKYHEYLQEIVDGYFADGKFEQKVQSLNELIAERVKADPSAFNTYQEYEAAVTELIKLGTLRVESIQGQLDGDIPSTSEGQQAAPDRLVDASSVDLSKLGENGPGGRGGMGGMGFGGFERGQGFGGQGGPADRMQDNAGARGQAAPTDGQTGTQTDGQTAAPTDEQTGAQTDE
ncbi:CotH kinase family protein [Paenibacillus sp. PAMC21692]|uniref:CotH kinase family protein n=1 Tax=Paenibacillus sp. PAMC21692 TaxID=2762320 RepID=UPI00164DDC71|nr:CotH kinase family protein [Paenibacillus sp. PAMC21692]QNK57817.1 CotH kinase family protein [Paenibacillus sp. PAMC21692]